MYDETCNKVFFLIYYSHDKLIKAYFIKVKDDEKEKMVEFFAKMTYVKGPYDDKKGYQDLDKAINRLPNGSKANRVFYLALPPTVFIPVTEQIKLNCMNHK